jgi:hypothetical protein
LNQARELVEKTEKDLDAEIRTITVERNPDDDVYNDIADFERRT